MAAAFNAQMGPEELVVQLNLMHAELSRRLQTNEAEHQRFVGHHRGDEIGGGQPRREAEQRATRAGWHHEHCAPSDRVVGQGLTWGT